MSLSNINSWPTTNPATAAFVHLIHHLKSQRPSISSKTWFPQLDTPSYFMPTRANKTRGSKCPSHWWLWKNQFQGQPEYIVCHNRTDPKAEVPKQYVTFFKAYIIFHSNGSLLHSEQDTSVLPILWRRSIRSMPQTKAAGPGTWVWPAGGLVVRSPTWISIDMAQWQRRQVVSFPSMEVIW